MQTLRYDIEQPLARAYVKLVQKLRAMEAFEHDADTEIHADRHKVAVLDSACTMEQLERAITSQI